MCTQPEIIKEKCKISLNKAWALSKSWKRAAIIWRTLDHVFAIGSFAASVAVVFISGVFNDATALIIIFSSLAAVLTLTGFACNPAKYMSNYRMAFQLLNEVLVSNTDENGCLKDSDKGFEAIRNAIVLGEKYIGKTFDVIFDNDTSIDNSCNTEGEQL